MPNFKICIEQLNEYNCQYKDDFYNNRCSHNYIRHLFILIGEDKFIKFNNGY